MKSNPTCAPNHARFAVIRNYQPARIERELLAHVFEIAGRSTAPGQEVTELTQVSSHEAANLPREQEIGSTESRVEVVIERRELEPAA
jgi:hypothetical protein